MEILRPTKIAAVLLCAFSLTSAGCAGNALTWQSPGEYTVRPGDTLYSISWRNRLDWRDLARWNGLSANGLIYPGQVLRLHPSPTQATRSVPTNARTSPSHTARTQPKAGRSTSSTTRPEGQVRVAGWYWPARGPVTAGFGDKNSLGNGLDIGGRLGDPVRAAANGRVVYAGSGLIGYGKLIIIKHNDTFLSAYGHNRTLAVKEGDLVKIGQKVAEIGEGPGKKPLLHFEIRVNGKPVDPIRYLPRR